MKYAHLIQIASFLSRYKKITSIKRISDMVLCICFDRQMLFFDLSKSSSSIYKNDDFMLTKEYNAPFDNLCKKRLNNANLKSIECLKNNRILKLVCEQNGSYKQLKSILYLEFTGRFTNAIITDENDIILEALRHTNSDRKIAVGETLAKLDEFDIKERAVLPIENFDEFFCDEFKRKNEKELLNLKAIKTAQIEKKLEALYSNLNTLENEADLKSQSQTMRYQANVLLSNLNQLKEYERDFTILDFELKPIKFTLNDSPKNSANAFFNKAKKLAQKAIGIRQERDNLNQKILFYINLNNLVKNSKTIGELEILYPKKAIQKNTKDENENVKNFYINDFKILIGRNEQGNIWLLKNSKKDDIWLHLKDLASPHVIIRSNKINIGSEILEFAAKICLNFSSVGAGKYEIDYTKRKNVKVVNGANVNYVDFKTIILHKD